MQRIERRDWSLWISALAVTLALTAAVAALSLSVLSKPDEPFFQFHISQSVRGLVGLVLLFAVYAAYQQSKLKRLRNQLSAQIDIERMRAQEFQKLAMVDQLTGLHNRRFGEERLAAEISRSQRHQYSLTVLSLDLDSFKKINDLYGHLAGDEALKIFARGLTKAIRGADLAVRIGGDEFLVILPECQFGQVQGILSRMANMRVELNGEKVPLNFSSGWTEYQSGESAEELLKRADDALYVDKQTRKGQVQLASS